MLMIFLFFNFPTNLTFLLLYFCNERVNCCKKTHVQRIEIPAQNWHVTISYYNRWLIGMHFVLRPAQSCRLSCRRWSSQRRACHPAAAVGTVSRTCLGTPNSCCRPPPDSIGNRRSHRGGRRRRRLLRPSRPSRRRAAAAATTSLPPPPRLTRPCSPTSVAARRRRRYCCRRLTTTAAKTRR